MYKQFFGLSKNPFEISPDPYFYHATPRHNEALANLHYGVGRRKGFIVITGEVGTGKTLLVRCLLAELRKNNIAFGYVFNPLLSTTEFFQYIMADLGLQYSGRSKTEMLLDLNRFLIQRHARGLITALVVDEAQALRPELLEEIRLLTNLETSQQKLLQIVLMGQPELEVVLDSPGLRQLKQRVSLRCQLLPLDEEQTRGYVLSRLERAGAKPNQLSGGQQQRVAIARALVSTPKLILADEPTGNLDTQTSEEIMGLFRVLNDAQGITVVLVTHEGDIALSSRRLIRIRDGRIADDGPTRQLLTRQP